MYIEYIAFCAVQLYLNSVEEVPFQGANIYLNESLFVLILQVEAFFYFFKSYLNSFKVFGKVEILNILNMLRRNRKSPRICGQSTADTLYKFLNKILNTAQAAVTFGTVSQLAGCCVVCKPQLKSIT